MKMKYALTITCDCGREIHITGDHDDLVDESGVLRNLVICECGEVIQPLISMSFPEREKFLNHEYHDPVERYAYIIDTPVPAFIHKTEPYLESGCIIEDGKTDLRVQMCNDIYRRLLDGYIQIIFKKMLPFDDDIDQLNKWHDEEVWHISRLGETKKILPIGF